MKTGLDEGLIPEKIVGITEFSGLLLHYVEWTDKTKQHELIPSEIMAQRFPQLVIKFYEQHVETTSLFQEMPSSFLKS
ncbi:hypothetical protein B4U79_11848, partial [Dinothrombium tinctorium]